MNNIKLLDCTLRDGGYYNNWNFSDELVNKYLKNISKHLNYVEIGFRFLEENISFGSTAYSKSNFLKKIQIPKNIKLGVMINASEFVYLGKNNILKTCKKVFPIKEKEISFIRIACHHFEVVKVLPIINYLNKKKYEVIVNIMQISEVNENIIRNLCKNLNRTKISCLYIADSLGSLNPDQIKKKIIIFKKYWKKDLGVHAHDNMKNALKNTLEAKKNGVTWLDGTILGMGRGAGNTKIEKLIKYFNKSNKTKDLELFIKKNFTKLKKQYHWGFNKYYNLAGKYKIHPTYIQTLLSDKRYKYFNYLKIINNLKKINSSKFNPIELTYSLFDKNQTSYGKKLFLIKNQVNPNITIIGSNPIIKRKRKFIEKILRKKKNNNTVVALNTTKHIKEEMIDFRIVSHPLRAMSELDNYKKITNKLIMPKGILPNKFFYKLKKRNIYFYGLKLNNTEIKISKNFSYLLNPLAIGYATAAMISLGCKNIEFIGFDLNHQTPWDNGSETIKKINKKYKNVKITFTKGLNQF